MINILGCGPSAALWDGSGPSIGVNDCWKFKPTDGLVCVNNGFDSERMAIIRNSKPKAFYTTKETNGFWAAMPNYRLIETRKFHRYAVLGQNYHSISSPLIAISVAVNQGHKEIVLWGIDFDRHPIVNEHILDREVDSYLRYFEAIGFLDVKVYLGSAVGVFAKYLPVWQCA